MSQDVSHYEDTISNHTVSKDIKDVQRRKLRTVTFTSEVFQTLVDDETTVCLSNPLASSASGNVKGINAAQYFSIKHGHGHEIESHVTLNVSNLMLQICEFYFANAVHVISNC